jgi:predicted RNA binding protein YcfA (HicA-like mRNA interferase family)
LGRLKPQPYREIKHRLGVVGFVETGQKGSQVKFVRVQDGVIDTAIVPGKHGISVGRLGSILNQAHLHAG